MLVMSILFVLISHTYLVLDVQSKEPVLLSDYAVRERLGGSYHAKAL